VNASTFFLLNLGLAFYNVGTIWAHEVDIFRTWRLVGPNDFRRVQAAHWRRLPYWVFVPVGLALAGSIGVLWFHPARMSSLPLWIAVLCQVASLALTGGLWGRWQARLSRDERGSESPYLERILRTHWIRTALVTVCALALLTAAVQQWG
jgi:hypothetical protein